ncbi:MAG: hypothetical protein AAGA08_00930 [Pseudomonadota bacterium]
MKKLFIQRSSSGALFCIVGVLVLSGILRVGGVGLAVANESSEFSAAAETELPETPEMTPDIKALLEMIKTRTAELNAKEAELQERTYALNAARELIDQNLARLEEAEKRLEATIVNVDGASEGDLDRLTAVYESMKPKVAAGLFEQMEPEFAAGFLGRMAPQAAAGIMSGLSTDAGYAISVVLAGRNANAPKN